jgi:cobyric acid synthase
VIAQAARELDLQNITQKRKHVEEEINIICGVMKMLGRLRSGRNSVKAR